MVPDAGTRWNLKNLPGFLVSHGQISGYKFLGSMSFILPSIIFRVFITGTPQTKLRLSSIKSSRLIIPNERRTSSRGGAAALAARLPARRYWMSPERGLGIALGKIRADAGSGWGSDWIWLKTAATSSITGRRYGLLPDHRRTEIGFEPVGTLVHFHSRGAPLTARILGGGHVPWTEFVSGRLPPVTN